MKIFELAQIETDEAENWHTLRLLVSLSVGQVSASYLSISSLKFHMNIEAQSSAAHRPSVPSVTSKVKGYSTPSEARRQRKKKSPPQWNE